MAARFFTLLFFLSAWACPAHAWTFYGGPTGDEPNGLINNSLESLGAAMEKYMKEQRRVMDEQLNEQQEKLIEKFGESVSADLRDPLSDEALAKRATLDKELAESLKGSNPDVALTIKTQAEQHRRLTLFYARLKAAASEGRKPMNFGSQLDLWAQLKNMQSEAILAQLNEMSISNARRVQEEARKTQLLDERATRKRLNEGYGRQ